MPIYWKLESKLTEHGLTPYRLRDLTGLSVPSCYELAKDEPVKVIKASTLATLCEVFECTPGDLLEYRER